MEIETGVFKSGFYGGEKWELSLFNGYYFLMIGDDDILISSRNLTLVICFKEFLERSEFNGSQENA